MYNILYICVCTFWVRQHCQKNLDLREVNCPLDCPRQRSVAWDRCLGSNIWPMRPETLERESRPTDLWSFSGRCGRLPWGPRLHAQTLWIQKIFDCNHAQVISLCDDLLSSSSCPLSAKGSWHSKRRKCCPFCEARSHTLRIKVWKV
jgi:hypothetical protein